MKLIQAGEALGNWHEAAQQPPAAVALTAGVFDDALHPHDHDGKFMPTGHHAGTTIETEPDPAHPGGKILAQWPDGASAEDAKYIEEHAADLPEVVTPMVLQAHRTMPPPMYQIFTGPDTQPALWPSKSGDHSLAHQGNKPPPPKAEKVYEEIPGQPPSLSENPGNGSSLNTAQRSALDSYTSEAGNRLINDGLRGKGHAPSAETIASLDSAIEKSTVGRPGRVYRGMSLPKALKVGDVISDPAYQSTGTDEKVAREFASLRATGKSEHLSESYMTPAHGEQVVLSIPLKHGDHALYGDMSVGEIILPRGLSWRVTAVTSDGLTEVEPA